MILSEFESQPRSPGWYWVMTQRYWRTDRGELMQTRRWVIARYTPNANSRVEWDVVSGGRETAEQAGIILVDRYLGQRPDDPRRDDDATVQEPLQGVLLELPL